MSVYYISYSAILKMLMNKMFECKNVNLPEQELKFLLTLNGKEQNYSLKFSSYRISFVYRDKSKNIFF